MASLRAEGAIATRHGIGAFVLGAAESASPPADALTLQSVASLLNVIEVRRGIEAATAAHAAARRSEDHLTDIRKALDAIARATARGSDGVEEDVRFHLAIARATGNPWVQLPSRAMPNRFARRCASPVPTRHAGPTLRAR